MQISKLQWRKINTYSEIKLELGSGIKKGKEGWITVDLYGADIKWDLQNGIPLQDNIVDRIYTSHMLEHIPFVNLVEFLKQIYRVLKPGGELSVCVPNAGYYIRSYLKGVDFMDRASWWSPASVNTGASLDQVNYIAYMGGEHKYMFDEENLLTTLKLAGFTNVSLRAIDITLDILERDIESIYAKAIK